MHETAPCLVVQFKFAKTWVYGALYKNMQRLFLEVNITEQGSFGKAADSKQNKKTRKLWAGHEKTHGSVSVLLTEVQKQPFIELIDGVQVTQLTQDADMAYVSRESWRRTTIIASETRALLQMDVIHSAVKP